MSHHGWNVCINNGIALRIEMPDDLAATALREQHKSWQNENVFYCFHGFGSVTLAQKGFLHVYYFWQIYLCFSFLSTVVNYSFVPVVYNR